MISILKKNGEIEHVTDINGAPSLDWLREKIECEYVEIVRTIFVDGSVAHMIVDPAATHARYRESGLLKSKEENPIATGFYAHLAKRNGSVLSIAQITPIVGNAVLLTHEHMLK